MEIKSRMSKCDYLAIGICQAIGVLWMWNLGTECFGIGVFRCVGAEVRHLETCAGTTESKEFSGILTNGTGGWIHGWILRLWGVSARDSCELGFALRGDDVENLVQKGFGCC